MADTTHSRSLLIPSLIAVCAFSVILSLSLAAHMKNTEARFRKDKASLVSDKMALKDELDALKEDLKSKTDAIASLEDEKTAIKGQLAALEKAAEELKGAGAKEVESLRQQVQALRNDSDVFSGATPVQVLQDFVARETDATIKRILADALTKLTMVKAGKAVTLEPIVVTGGSDGTGAKQGKILSLDRKNALIVINLGSANGVKEGRRLKILGDEGEIAFATVIRTRYEISAAFVESFRGRHTIQDVREDLAIAME